MSYARFINDWNCGRTISYFCGIHQWSDSLEISEDAIAIGLTCPFCRLENRLQKENDTIDKLNMMWRCDDAT